jgi:hypothetical protein
LKFSIAAPRRKSSQSAIEQSRAALQSNGCVTFLSRRWPGIVSILPF